MPSETGRCFLSYRRSHRDLISRVGGALHDLGVPTWRDLDDLEEEPTEEAIKCVLVSQEIACAILLLTPDVVDSEFLRRVEVPALLTRKRADSGFFVVVVAAGGLTVEKAAEVLDPRFVGEYLPGWNLRQLSAEPKDSEILALAERVLRRRLRRVHELLSLDEPLRLGLFTRVRPTEVLPLVLDWSPRFMGRFARPGSWEKHLIPALEGVASAIREEAPGRRVLASGYASLSAGLALGAAFLDPGPSTLSWLQAMPEGLPGPQTWSFDSPRESSGMRVEVTPLQINGSDLAVTISVADRVEPAFQAVQGELPLRAVIRVAPVGAVRTLIDTPGQAADLACSIRDAIRSARQDFKILSRIHLFLAGPLGLAVLLGQLLNTLGQVQTWEHVPEPAGGRFEPSVLLHPGI